MAEGGNWILAVPVSWSGIHHCGYNVILWSCDGDTSWHTDNLPEELPVVGMFTEPGEKHVAMVCICPPSCK